MKLDGNAILLPLVLAHLFDFKKMILFSFLFSFVPIFHSYKSSGAHTDYSKFLIFQMIKGPENLVYQSHSFKMLHRFVDVDKSG